ncbi:AgrD family cyclic lactone autoinducer peptide [Candidatus Enterococcus clewellii]|uniref:Uncharacterized protein n=1 Tax=Candidatus Enterococcus clewellii TaxID=1834193 RepID=A0A242K9X8_9ENTE|nr:cyclic lactone autoinducer peptide [Enterococcus sp. 9E7_DIV0242]OTP17350.1 hypothetical protein A5888_001488 [Enterococcus sp. 9E7_DIV0242]
MKNLLVGLFTTWGGQNLVMCCGGFLDEVEIPKELLNELK